jgi:hypothetical protein
MYKNGIMKPTKNCLEREKERATVWISSKYTLCMYGNITMNPFIQFIYILKKREIKQSYRLLREYFENF